MNKKKLWEEIETGYKLDKRINPTMPDHIVAKAGVVNAQAGFLQARCLSVKYDLSQDEKFAKIQNNQVKQDAILTIIKTIRFLETLEN